MSDSVGPCDATRDLQFWLEPIGLVTIVFPTTVAKFGSFSISSFTQIQYYKNTLSSQNHNLKRTESKNHEMYWKRTEHDKKRTLQCLVQFATENRNICNTARNHP